MAWRDVGSQVGGGRILLIFLIAVPAYKDNFYTDRLTSCWNRGLLCHSWGSQAGFAVSFKLDSSSQTSTEQLLVSWLARRCCLPLCHSQALHEPETEKKSKNHFQAHFSRRQWLAIIYSLRTRGIYVHLLKTKAVPKSEKKSVSYQLETLEHSQASSRECVKCSRALEPFTQQEFGFFPPGNDSDYKLIQPHPSTPHHFLNYFLSWYMPLQSCHELAMKSLWPTQTCPVLMWSSCFSLRTSGYYRPVLSAPNNGRKHFAFLFFHAGGWFHFPCAQDSALYG